MTSNTSYICHLNQDECIDYPDEGWYFSDECEQMNGPYQTEESAAAALDNYVKNVL